MTKQKTILSVLLVCMFVFAGLIFAACGNRNEAVENNDTQSVSINKTEDAQITQNVPQVETSKTVYTIGCSYCDNKGYIRQPCECNDYHEWELTGKSYWHYEGMFRVELKEEWQRAVAFSYDIDLIYTCTLCNEKWGARLQTNILAENESIFPKPPAGRCIAIEKCPNVESHAGMIQGIQLCKTDCPMCAGNPTFETTNPDWKSYDKNGYWYLISTAQQEPTTPSDPTLCATCGGLGYTTQTITTYTIGCKHCQNSTYKECDCNTMHEWKLTKKYYYDDRKLSDHREWPNEWDRVIRGWEGYGINLTYTCKNCNKTAYTGIHTTFYEEHESIFPKPEAGRCVEIKDCPNKDNHAMIISGVQMARCSYCQGNPTFETTDDDWQNCYDEKNWYLVSTKQEQIKTPCADCKGKAVLEYVDCPYCVDGTAYGTVTEHDYKFVESQDNSGKHTEVFECSKCGRLLFYQYDLAAYQQYLNAKKTDPNAKRPQPLSIVGNQGFCEFIPGGTCTHCGGSGVIIRDTRNK